MRNQDSRNKRQQTLSFVLSRVALVALLVFTFITRFYRLGQPAMMYFDEVYHVQTAYLIANNDPRAYEWWHQPLQESVQVVSTVGLTSQPNPHYFDWLHPPLSKLLQAASLQAFGFKPFAWRLPMALAGCGLVFVVFLLAERVIFLARPLLNPVLDGGQSFKQNFQQHQQDLQQMQQGSQQIEQQANDSQEGHQCPWPQPGRWVWLGLLAASLVALDGLALVQSRIGMNDIIVTFFTSLSLLFYLQSYGFTLSFTKKFTKNIENKDGTGIKRGAQNQSEQKERKQRGSTEGARSRDRRKEAVDQFRVYGSRQRWSLLLTGVGLGLALATKWTAVLLLLPILCHQLWILAWPGLVLLRKRLVVGKLIALGAQRLQGLDAKQLWRDSLRLLPLSLFSLVLLPATIYLASYSQMFLQGKNVNHFVQLHRQISWYHTHRNSQHRYASSPLVWFLNLRPVWYWVQSSAYLQRFKPLTFNQSVANFVNFDSAFSDSALAAQERTPEASANLVQSNKSAHIYALSTPLLVWLALPALVLLVGRLLKAGLVQTWVQGWRLQSAQQRLAQRTITFLLACYFCQWLPLLFSPRILFYYHYLPALPILFIFIAWFLGWLRITSKFSFRLMLILIVTNFVLFLPHWLGLPVSKTWAQAVYFAVESWR